MSNKDDEKSGIHDLIPIAIFIGGWILLGYIDKQSPGTGKNIIVGILSLAGIYVVIKIFGFIFSQTKSDLFEWCTLIAKFLFWLVLITIVVGLFDCGGGGFNLDGVRGL